MINEITNPYDIANACQAIRQAGPVAKIRLENVGSLNPRAVFDYEARPGGQVGDKIILADRIVMAQNPLAQAQNNTPAQMVLTDDDNILTATLANFQDFINANGQANNLFFEDQGQFRVRIGPYEIKRRIKKEGFRFLAVLFNSGEDSSDFRFGLEITLADRNATDLNGVLA